MVLPVLSITGGTSDLATAVEAGAAAVIALTSASTAVAARSARRSAAASLRKQDELAAQQKKDAVEAKDAANIVADKLVESNAAVAEATTQTHDQLAVIHTLVNSDMTAAMAAELRAVQDLVKFMENIKDPTPEEVVDLEVHVNRMTELQTLLVERGKAAAGLPKAAPLPASEPPVKPRP